MNVFLISTVTELIIIIMLFAVLFGIARRAKALGLPVTNKKEGIIAIVWGKVAKLRFVPLKSSNIVEVEIGGKKASWVVDDLPIRPVSDLYGVGAVLLHTDTAQAVDPDVASSLDGIDKDTEAVVKEYFKALRDLDELKSYLQEAERAGDKVTSEKIREMVARLETYVQELEERLKLSPIVESTREGKTVVIPQKDGHYLIIRPLKIEKIRQFARALPAPSLFSAVQQYVNELKGKQTDVLKVAFAIALVIIAVGVLIALKQQPVDYEKLARALKGAAEVANKTNVTKVVIG